MKIDDQTKMLKSCCADGCIGQCQHAPFRCADIGFLKVLDKNKDFIDFLSENISFA